MQNKQFKPGKVIIGFAVGCLFIAGTISVATFWDMSDTRQSIGTGGVIAASIDFDHKSDKSVIRYQQTSNSYLAGASSERTLNEYYSYRQYRGSPPFVPHPVKNQFGVDENCLACHAEGGFVAKWNRYTPLTPHPEKEMCQQCHVSLTTGDTFIEHNWISSSPPRLGQSELPGSPPPIPHDLQMREDCVTCHSGPGAVAELKMRHEPRGICRQCHVPVANIEAFNRDSQSP